MELDDLKNIWQSGLRQPVNEETTEHLVENITHKKYKSKMNKIRYPEMGGSIVCLAAAVFIGSHFYRLQTAWQQGTGAVAILLLVLLPLISLLSLKQLTFKNNMNQSYAGALTLFAKQKLKFYRLQKLNVTLSCLLLVVVVILLSQLFGSREVVNSKSFWLFSFTIGYLFLLFFSSLVSRYYKKTIRQTEDLLREIEGSTV